MGRHASAASKPPRRAVRQRDVVVDGSMVKEGVLSASWKSRRWLSHGPVAVVVGSKKGDVESWIEVDGAAREMECIIGAQRKGLGGTGELTRLRGRDVECRGGGGATQSLATGGTLRAAKTVEMQ